METHTLLILLGISMISIAVIGLCVNFLLGTYSNTQKEKLIIKMVNDNQFQSEIVTRFSILESIKFGFGFGVGLALSILLLSIIFGTLIVQLVSTIMRHGI